MANTQYTGVPGSILALPGVFVPGSIGSTGLPLSGGVYLQAPPGYQPWNPRLLPTSKGCRGRCVRAWRTRRVAQHPQQVEVAGHGGPEERKAGAQ